MVTALGLVFAINVTGLAFALLLTRWVASRQTAAASARLVVSAVHRATTALLHAVFRRIAGGLAVLIGLLVTAHLLLGHHANARGGSASLFWSSIALILGAAATCTAVQASVSIGSLAVSRTLGAARLSLGRAMRVSVRAGGAAGLLAESISLLGVAILTGLVHATASGGPPQQRTMDLAARLVQLLPAYGVGAAVAALLIQRAGATFHAAADAGGDMAGERAANLEHDDARNPAVVADLVGDRVGSVASRSADLFVSASLGHVVVFLVAALLCTKTPPQDVRVLALVGLPLAVRAFGIIASAFGVMVVTSEETGSPTTALWRGHATTSVVAVGGLAGAAIWLGGSNSSTFLLAGLLGLLAVIGLSHAARWRVGRRSDATRELLESLRVHEASATLQALGLGLGSLLLPVATLAIAMAAAWQIGVGSGLPAGGPLAVLTATAAALAVGPYVLAVAHFAPVADSVRGVIAMAQSAGDEQQRARRLDEAGLASVAVAQNYLSVVGVLVALCAATVLSMFSTSPDEPTPATPGVIWSGFLGAALVWAYAGDGLQRAARAARRVAAEVDRQLRGFPREHAIVRVPSDFAPNYRSVIEIATRAALDKSVLASSAAVLVPLSVALGLGLLNRSDDPTLVNRGLASFVIVAALAGLSTSLALDGTRAVLTAARRSADTRPGSTGFGAAIAADALADALGNSAGPAAHIVGRLGAAVCLAIAPIIS
ncbi:MAG: sodium/proton-translocating pyrophosphatase [Polyangiaceae bacterium]|nr:sodium/proton-translocating pyrophosphatase [Polyangiaceae bacterium]